ncbi:MAG TPA: YbaB/EbfC family nucleoid-associated protein [Aggregatilineaceae bacterium]|nr:YbaB/EbfC family nucleoid-associated protein [Aggregatilineaceae bacterium]
MTKKGGFGGRPGGMPNQASLMKQFQKMQDDMAAAQSALESEIIAVSVGGGALTVEINGGQKVQAIKINPDAIDTSDEEWLIDLQDLLVAAVNQAIEQSQALAAERMNNATGNLGSMLPPGLSGLF